MVSAQVQGSIGEDEAGCAVARFRLHLSDQYGADLPAIVSLLPERTGIVHWTGAVASSVCANGVEYDGEPALALMVAALAPDTFQVFSGRLRPSPGSDPAPDGSSRSHTALVHADPALPDWRN
jgi:hypothetical protein